MSKLGIVWIIPSAGGDASQGGSDKVSKPPTRWVLMEFRMDIYIAKWHEILKCRQTTWCDSFWTGWHSRWGQTWVKQNWEIVLFQIRFTFDCGVSYLFCFKLPKETAAQSQVVGAQCPAAKHRRSSASAYLELQCWFENFGKWENHQHYFWRGPLLTCMVQSFFNGTQKLRGIKVDAKCCW